MMNDKFVTFLKKAFLDWRKSPNAPTPRGGFPGYTMPSQYQFSQYLGISPTSLEYYLIGERLPTKKAALKLAGKLGDEVLDILGFTRDEGG
jgi:hypothetical protein